MRSKYRTENVLVVGALLLASCMDPVSTVLTESHASSPTQERARLVKIYNDGLRAFNSSGITQSSRSSPVRTRPQDRKLGQSARAGLSASAAFGSVASAMPLDDPPEFPVVAPIGEDTTANGGIVESFFAQDESYDWVITTLDGTPQSVTRYSYDANAEVSEAVIVAQDQSVSGYTAGFVFTAADLAEFSVSDTLDFSTHLANGTLPDCAQANAPAASELSQACKTKLIRAASAAVRTAFFGYIAYQTGGLNPAVNRELLKSAVSLAIHAKDAYDECHDEF